MANPWDQDAIVQPAAEMKRVASFSSQQPLPENAAPAGPSWSEVPGQAYKNVGKSAKEFATGIVQPILHPVDTANAFYEIGRGVVSKAAGMFGDEKDPAAKAKREAAADALGKHLKDRYGSIEGLKKTIANDPVGFLADASLVLTGGGAAVARAPGAVGRAGEAVRTAGSAIDPIANTVRAVGGAGRLGGFAATQMAGLTTGAGARPIQTAFEAGRTGNQAFTQNMRGNVPINNVVSMAESGVEAMGNDRRMAYRANMAATKADKTSLDLMPIYDVIKKARDDTQYRGVAVSDEAAAALDKALAKVQQFDEITGGAGLPAEGLDALKRSLYTVLEGTQQGTTPRTVIQGVYNQVKDEIVKQVPSYAKAMEDYSNASDNIGEIRRTLSVNDRASTDTTARKLQSVMRNNVNTNYGERARLVDELAQYQPDLPMALAGQALNSMTPRGLAGGAASANALYGVAMSPQALAALPLASPRIVGEAAYGTGRVAQGVADLGITPNMLIQGGRAGYAADEIIDAARIDPELGLTGTVRPRNMLMR